MTTIPANETKDERKARVKQEKLDAKTAKAQAKVDAKAAKAQAKADEERAKAAKKAAKKGGTTTTTTTSTTTVSDRDERLEAKWERYNQLRANVRRRRAMYGIIITLAILTFVATAWDIILNDSDFKFYLLPVYVLLFLWALILLFSRRRHLQEVAELEAMQRTFLECEKCNSVFQFGELRFGERKRVGFSCPVCGDESALPGPGAIPVERVLPEAAVTEVTYACGNCSEQIVVGTFGATPVESRFRACPHCGVPGQVSLA